MLSALIYLIYFYGMILFFFGLDELPNLGINGYQTKPVRLPGIQKSRTVNIIMHVGINFLYSVPGMIFMKYHIKWSESWLVVQAYHVYSCFLLSSFAYYVISFTISIRQKYVLY